MQIECTKKSLDFLGKETQPADQTVSPFHAWSAHLMLVERRKTLIVVNDAARCGFAIHGLTAPVRKKLDELILEGIRRTLLYVRIAPDLINEYLEDCGTEISYTCSRDRSTALRISRLIEDLEYQTDLWIPGEIFQPKVMWEICSMFDRRNDDMLGREAMRGYFGEFYGTKSPCACTMADVNIFLEDTGCSRKLRIPADYTLHQLHQVIQASFCWTDFHSHEFCDQDDMNLSLCFPECYPKEKQDPLYEDDEKMECMVTLRQAFEAATKLQYVYDFGDCWTHWITLSGMEEGAEDVDCRCILALGDAPPEDVGGTSGFEEFRAIMQDPHHPDYASVSKWAAYQRWTSLDMASINRKLRCR